MIGYLFLAIALLAGATKGYCGKCISGRIVTVEDSALVNVGRMLCCTVIGAMLAFVQNGASSFSVDVSTLGIAFLDGACSALFVITWMFAVKQSAYMTVEVFLLIGTVIPISLSAILLDEEIGFIQCVGIALLAIAVYIMSTYNTSVKGKLSFKALLPSISAGVVGGLSDFSKKMFSSLKNGDSVAAFNLYTYIFAAFVLLIFYFVLRLGNKKHREEESGARLLRGIFGYVLIMAVCLYTNSYFKTLAAEHITATRLYPLNQGASVVLSLLMSAIFFKERINRKCIVGICLAFAAVLMINLL